MKHFQIHVKGSGIVAKSAAILLAHEGFAVALDAPVQGKTSALQADVRAYALSALSRQVLTQARVWSNLPSVCPVYDMWIQGDQPGQKPLHFSAYQQQVEALAWMVPAQDIDQALTQALTYQTRITRVTGEEGAVSAELSVICEGKASDTRKQLGVEFDTKSYDHLGIAARLVADQAHGQAARQWFRAPDVLALLPLAQAHELGLVWSQPRDEALRLMALGDADFEAELTAACGAALGPLRLSGVRATWPLMRAQAQSLCGPGWVLAGDAAHVVHPLAGQGLNLGLADVHALVQVLQQRQAHEAWRPLGDERLLRRYQRIRTLPNLLMGEVTDGLLELFSNPHPLVRQARNWGLQATQFSTLIKKNLAAQAFGR